MKGKTMSHIIPLSLAIGAVLGLYLGALIGALTERRRWHDYHRTVMAGLRAHVVGTPPPAEDNHDYLSRLDNVTADDEAWADNTIAMLLSDRRKGEK